MPVGKTKDAGWEIGVSRTIPLPLEEAWARIEDPAAWLGEPATDVRSLHPLQLIRVGWNSTIVQVRVVPTKTGTSVRFHQERLAGCPRAGAPTGPLAGGARSAVPRTAPMR